MKIKRRIKALIIVSAVVLLLVGTGLVLKNIFLNQIEGKIRENFGYSKLRLSILPPKLIVEDARSKSVSPFFSAKKVSVKVSFRSLLSKDRPLTIVIEHPVIRIYSTSVQSRQKEEKALNLVLPFVIEKGLIEEGVLYYWGKETRVQLIGINALFTQSGDQFSIMGESAENILALGAEVEPIEGKLSFLLQGKGKEIDIKRVKISGPRGVLKAEGSLTEPAEPEIQLKIDFNLQAGLVLDIIDVPFATQGWAEGEGFIRRKGGIITGEASFLSKELLLNGFFMGKVGGNVEFDGKGGRVDFQIQKKDLPQEFVRVNFDGNRVWGVARRFFLNPIITLASFPWPVSSPGWGSFSLDDQKLQAEVEFRDEVLEDANSRYAFKGLVKVEWDRKLRFSFFSEELESSFALVSVDGGLVVGRTVDLTIDGEIKNLKKAREFTSLVLEKTFPFPEIRGKGQSKIRIFGDFQLPQIQANFSLGPGGFGKFDVSAVSGEAEIRENNFFGNFDVEDPSFEGQIGVYTSADEIKVETDVKRGLVETILPGFDIPAPLQGEASGRFDYRQTGESVRLEGNFSSPQIKFSGQKLRDVQGRMDWTGEGISFSQLEFGLHLGKVKGSAHLQLIDDKFEVEVSGDGLDLTSIYPSLQGTLSFDAKGNGFMGRDSAAGDFVIKDLHIYPFQKTVTKGEWQFTFAQDRIDVELDGNFEPGQNRFFVSLDIPFEGDLISGNIRGFFTNFDLLLPWRGAKGRVNYIAEIQGTKSSPQIKGAVDFQGSVFPFPQFAHAMRDYSGHVFFENGAFSIRSLQGRLGEGDVQGSGRLRLGKGGVEEINVRAEGKNLLLSPLERTRALAEGNLHLIKNNSRFDLKGEFFVHRLSWRREIMEKFAFSSSPYYESQREPNFFDDLNLNIRIKAEDDAWMDNSLGRVRGRFDLSVTGNINDPIILGDIEAIDGELMFQDREFRILRGRVSFINPLTVEPYLSFKGETYVKDYRVTFSLDGLLDRLNPEFSSSPPLPPEDVLALLALGEAFKKTYSYDMSTQLSTASLLSFQLAEEAKRRAEGLFSIDRFRIDPFILGSSAEVTARLTVGKNISRNFSILYSTNLTTQREEITRIEWELTRDFSVVGIRDEKGRISIDVKVHKRF
jgi:hypothetical protein